MNFDTVEIILIAIMIAFGFAAIYVTKRKPKAKIPKVQITQTTVKMAENWTVFYLDKEGNCINSAQIPQSDEAFIIGSSPEADFIILNKKVSRKHLIVIANNGGLSVSDNKSSNSTFRNGKKILGCPIENKQLLWLADSPIVFIAPGTATDEKMLKMLFKSNTEKFGIPEIISQ